LRVGDRAIRGLKNSDELGSKLLAILLTETVVEAKDRPGFERLAGLEELRGLVLQRDPTSSSRLTFVFLRFHPLRSNQ
jgi:hypothetical protein